MMTDYRIFIAGLVFAALVVLVCASGCIDNEAQKTSIRVVPAGSLVLPFEEAAKEFEQLHPGVDVQIEGHGSIQAVRQVTDLHRPVDVVAVADETLIPDLMFRPIEGGTGNYSDWYIPFAKNRMVIAYTGKSAYANEITTENWFRILMRPGVRVGFSNPMLDAAGYRAIMVVTLADEAYPGNEILPDLIGNHFNPPLPVREENGTITITLPEVMRPADDRVVIRDGSVALMSLLEAGGIDYAFEYRSVAEGQDVLYVDLPASIDLSSAKYRDQYKKVKVVLGFQRFSTIGKERTGGPVIYAITVPTTASHPDLAEEFVGYAVERSRSGGRGWPAPLDANEHPLAYRRVTSMTAGEDTR